MSADATPRRASGASGLRSQAALRKQRSATDTTGRSAFIGPHSFFPGLERRCGALRPPTEASLGNSVRLPDGKNRGPRQAELKPFLDRMLGARMSDRVRTPVLAVSGDSAFYLPRDGHTRVIGKSLTVEIGSSPAPSRSRAAAPQSASRETWIVWSPSSTT